LSFHDYIHNAFLKIRHISFDHHICGSSIQHAEVELYLRNR